MRFLLFTGLFLIVTVLFPCLLNAQESLPQENALTDSTTTILEPGEPVLDSTLDSLNTQNAAQESVKNQSLFFIYKSTDDFNIILQKLDVPLETLSREAPLQLSAECNALCSNCLIDISSEDYTFENPLCNQIDLNCKCTTFLKETAIYKEQTAKDSVERIRIQLARMENAKILKDSVQKICDSIPQCIVKFRVSAKEHTLLGLKARSEKIEVKEDSLKSDTLQTIKDSTVSVKDTVPYKKSNEKLALFYFGVNLLGGYTAENCYPSSYHDCHHESDDYYDGMDLGIGASFKFYFYKWGSISSGLNIIYRHLFDDVPLKEESGWYNGTSVSATLSTHNLTLEIPFNVRLGFGLPDGSALFLSNTFAIRKPFYEWIFMDVEYSAYYSAYSNSYDDYYYDYSNSVYHDGHYEAEGFNNAGDFEFNNYFGIGIQLKRLLSLQFQWLVFSGTTYNGHEYGTSEGLDYPSTWLVTLDYTF